METAVRVRDAAPLSAESLSTAENAGIERAGLRHAAANLGVAAMFFLTLAQHARHFHGGLTDLIWMIGATLMGVLSLVRVPPKMAMINVSSILATSVMMIAPALMRADSPSTGVLEHSGLALVLLGSIASEGARLYLGRAFGLLPANRGVVSTGPFAMVRHPIYSGWLVFTLGYLMAYPTVFNLSLLTITLPFMMWRIDLEEQVLRQDPAYAAYCEITHYRILPPVY